ncbi:thermosome subunit alpha [Halonotius pteroides]|uniref:Thermosome subunit n=1 Tax=Halonotius pteroides TaxID=268735 RepID=A0A3A6QF62_9EURY|nr:thermosome subunit alpha [Halonotius pteroides]RJX51975.1 thermosome subunit [Halonotius pteroides]
MAQRQQPMVILSEDNERTQGEDAQDSNIRAGKAVANSVRTTLGPKGMDKMLVGSSGDVTITNDGATILNEMDIEHPAAQMLVEVAETQEIEVGDGTTTASVLAGELLAEAEELLDQDLHPTVIVEGYHEAAKLAHEAVDDQTLAVDLDDDTLEAVARSSMTGKGTGDVTVDTLAEPVVSAVQQVATDAGVDREDIHIHTHPGASTSATELIEGVVIDETPLDDAAPSQLAEATTAILDTDLEFDTGEADAEYNITDVDQLNEAIAAEEEELEGYADAIVDAGVELLFVTGDIDDRVASHLAAEEIVAFEDIGSSDADAIAAATGARQLGTLEDIEDADLGTTAALSVETYGEDEFTFVEGADAAHVSLFVRGSTDHVVDELERALNDALDVVIAALDAGGVVGGAGAAEVAIADHVRGHAASVEGRKQLAIEAFATAVDELPRTLAENTGMDPIDALVDLRARHDAQGRAGLVSTGRSGTVGDPVEEDILDPAAVKHEAVDSATEAATMILRIDDVISSDG